MLVTSAVASSGGQPERAKDYFNQSLLEDSIRSEEDAPVPRPAN